MCLIFEMGSTHFGLCFLSFYASFRAIELPISIIMAVSLYEKMLARLKTTFWHNEESCFRLFQPRYYVTHPHISRFHQPLPEFHSWLLSPLSLTLFCDPGYASWTTLKNKLMVMTIFFGINLLVSDVGDTSTCR